MTTATADAPEIREDAVSEPVVAGAAADAAASVTKSTFYRVIRNRSVILGGTVLAIIVVLGLLAPWLGTSDPVWIDATFRAKPPSTEHFWNWMSGQSDITGKELPWGFQLMGTDLQGRDIYSRVLYGARVSLLVGTVVALLSVGIGLFIGLMAGYIRAVDAVIMRIMDGLMAIPGILLAIALVSLTGASLFTVIMAILVPEVPRVVRVVRSVVLTIREEPYVEAAISVGTPLPLILWRHVMPNTIAPLLVQGTYICASAMLVEAILSFLGAGLSPDLVPTWGNIIADGRTYFQVYGWLVLFPSIFLAITVLAVNVMGDGLRDTLDPRLAKRF